MECVSLHTQKAWEVNRIDVHRIKSVTQSFFLLISCLEFKVLRQFGIRINHYANYRKPIVSYPGLAYGQKDLNVKRTYTT